MLDLFVHGFEVIVGIVGSALIVAASFAGGAH